MGRHDIQHNNIQHKDIWQNPPFSYIVGHYNTVMLSATVMFHVIMLSINMLSFNMLSVVMLAVITMSVVASFDRQQVYKKIFKMSDMVPSLLIKRQTLPACHLHSTSEVRLEGLNQT
jgi:hypothetical protein